jgi:hypothetical protein
MKVFLLWLSFTGGGQPICWILEQPNATECSTARTGLKYSPGAGSSMAQSSSWGNPSVAAGSSGVMCVLAPDRGAVERDCYKPVPPVTTP